MDDNVVLVRFADQSKAYQALSTLKDVGADGRLEVRSAVLLERGSDGMIRVPEGADNATGFLLASGGLLGMLVGVLGGPLGMLLGGYAGLLGGATGAALRDADADVALDAISQDIAPGQTVLVAEVGEVTDEVLDKAMTNLGGTVTRRPASDVYDEIQSAENAQQAADQEARRVLREQRRAEHKQKWQQFTDKVKSALS
jgi:uncharacterized membrane protein